MIYSGLTQSAPSASRGIDSASDILKIPCSDPQTGVIGDVPRTKIREVRSKNATRVLFKSMVPDRQSEGYHESSKRAKQG